MNILTGAEVDTLVALVERGPCWAGDVPSKSAKASLIQRGFAFPTVVNGEDGFTAVTPQGVAAYKQHFNTALDGAADTIWEAKANRIARGAINSASARSG